MDKNTYIILIVGMLIATYIPRVIPFFLIKQENVSKKVYRFLSYIPYAMLGAMIMPGFISGISGEPIISVIAFFGGALVCFKFGGTIGPILTAIATATLLQLV